MWDRFDRQATGPEPARRGRSRPGGGGAGRAGAEAAGSVRRTERAWVWDGSRETAAAAGRRAV